MTDFRRLKGVGAVLVAVSVVLLAVLCVAVAFFRAESFAVKGNETYGEAEIIEACGIKAGTSVFRLDFSEAEKSLLEKCTMIKSCEIRFVPFEKVVIEVTEEKPDFNTKCGATQVLFTQELRVTGISVGELNAENTETVPVMLPAVNRVIAGKKLEFRDADGCEYVEKLLYALRNSDLWERITEIDASSNRGASVTVNGKYVLRFGGLTDIELKLRVGAAMLESETVKNSKEATLDLSDPKEVVVSIAK